MRSVSDSRPVLAALLLTALTLQSGCKEWLVGGEMPSPDVPAFADPKAHAEPVAVAQVPVVPEGAKLIGRRDEAKAAPAEAPVAAVPADGEAEPPPLRLPEPTEPGVVSGRLDGVDELDQLPTRDGPEEGLDPAAPPATPEDEGAAWIESTAEVTPGCLRDGRVPSLPLPSPEALSWLLTVQPRGFQGIAREALACLLGVSRTTNAEIFGNTVFEPTALGLRAALAGDERLVGIVAAGVVTEEPRGVGTLVVVLDERDDGWTVRDSLFLPWAGSDATHKVSSLSDERLVLKKRSGVILRQRDRDNEVEHHVTLTTLDALTEVARFTLSGVVDEGTVKATVTASGKSFPKGLLYRGVVAGGDSAADGLFGAYVIETWKADGEAPYRLDRRQDGKLSLNGAAELLLGDQPAHAAWVYDAIPKPQRQDAAALALGARIDGARGRVRQAVEYWKKAVKAKDAPPDLQRDYARYLAREKRKKDAVKAFEAYLELAPDASDRAEVEAELDAVRGRPR
ncbi:MAG: hypothetical protein IV100_15300 [Myxococcales bacterium]|nr:hypothetical protein [Myxococcales bacterium]